MSLLFPNLPPPSLIDESTYEQIFASKLAKFRELRPGYDVTVEGDPIRLMAQIAADDELKLRKRINQTYLQTLIPYASGTNLDNLVTNANLARQVKQAAVYDEDGILVAPEVLETDEQLRTRYTLAWHALGLGTFGWYKFRALNADVSVKDAYVIRSGPGEVTVFIQSEDITVGGVPTPELLATVTADLNELHRRILCGALVISPITVVPYAIQARIIVANEADKESKLAEVQQAANEFVVENNVIDRDIPISRFYAVLSLAGIADVKLASPVADIVTTTSQAPHATSINITLA